MQHGLDLYKAGISYHAYGTIKQGRKVQAYFYKLCKPATTEQIAELRKAYPHVPRWAVVNKAGRRDYRQLVRAAALPPIDPANLIKARA